MLPRWQGAKKFADEHTSRQEIMKLAAFVPDGYRIDVRPAPVERAWMNATDQRFAYRCLPLNIANAFGWEILCPSGFAAAWNGGKDKSAIEIDPDQGTTAPAISHFAHGILTFHIPCLFRTEQGFDLMVQGPINRPKDSISPLAGIIETDWAPYSFTMNWAFTRPGAVVRFEKDEPFCHIFPIRRAELELFDPTIRSMSDDPELEREYRAWQDGRRQFNADLEREGSQARQKGWQRTYYRASGPDLPNRTRLRLKDFRDETGGR
jgi:Family of unknown function (DUF6065)